MNQNNFKLIFKTFILSALMVAQVHFAYAQTASILPNAKTTFVDANGKPLVNGKVEFYIPGTGTLKTTWKDAAETIPNTNPVILDAAGRALILGDGSYRQVVKDRNNNVIWDQVTSSTGSGSGGGSASTGDGDLVGTIKPWAGYAAPNQYMFTYGQEVSRATYVSLYTAIVPVQSVFCNSGSPILNGLSDTNSFWVGMTLEVSCLGAGFSTVVSKTASTVTMAANANVTTNTNASFFLWGRGNGTTTFNLPDFRGMVLAGNNIMGGTASSRLTTTFFGVQDPNSAGAEGGSQSKVLLLSNLPPYTPAGSVATLVQIPTSATNPGGNPAFTPVGNNFPGLSTIPSSGSFTGTDNGAGGTAASAVVAAGGSGYTVGAQTLTLTGGTCSIPPQFTVTGAAGAITNPVLLTAGLCTVIPSNPAATSTSVGSGTSGTLTVTWTAGAFSIVQPTRTSNFIIKVTPDTNSATASGVTSLGLMTGDIACGSGLTCTGNIISVGNIPAAQAAVLGGVLSSTCAASNWFNSLTSGTGVFNCAQPNFTDLAGTIALAQISANLITYAKIQQGTALSLLGVAGNATADWAPIAAASDGQIMRRAGTSLAFGSVDLANSAAVGSSLLALANGGCNAALTASNGGILWSNATQCQILSGTATARLPLLSGATATPVWGAYTLPASVTSGGVACFTSTTVQASSGLLTADAILLGGGAGVCPTPMASLGTTTTVLHGNAAGAPTFSAIVSADLNITATSCTNQFVSAISTGGVGTCASVPIGTAVSGLGTGVATALASNLSAAGGVTSTIASGTSALGTSAIASATCATVVTTSATNTATTDVVTAGFNGDPTAVTGYIPSTSGMLTIIVYPTANNVNFKVCNNTLLSITPGAITLNWRVVR